MADILEEIQELSKMFNNLFEVDGLGDPAVDVPPSQNKIKRDRKTKDGKVEVVSVEDELFPYEGNKREQFRQKVIATINNMIQGTATLEDLLQLVRQKKAPLKEAMEVLENMMNIVEDDEKKIEPSQPSKPAYNPPKRNPNYKPGKKKVDPDEFERIFRKHIKKADEDSLKEAIEVLESLQSEVEKKYGKLFDKNLSTQGLLKHHKLGEIQTNELIDAAKRNLPAEEKDSSLAIDREANKIEARRNNTKNKIGQRMTDLRTVGYGGKLRGLSEIPDNREADAKNGYKVATEKAIRRHEQKKASIKEAMELMEDIMSAIKKKHGEPEFKKSSCIVTPLNKSAELINKAADIRQKEYQQEIEKNPDVNLYDKRFQTKNSKGEKATKDRSSQYRSFSDDWKLPKADDEKIEDSIKRHEKKEQKKAPLKEALDILEAIKDEIKNHQKWHGGGATFSYKGNDYSYSPERGLRKEGQAKDDRNPVKKLVDDSNKEFDKARKYNYDTERQSRAVGRKINKEVAKLEKTEGKGAFPGKTNDTIKKLIDTANAIKANKADADKNFTKVNKRQQDMADDAKGVKHQMYDVWTSKKGDNFGWKPTVKTSEALEEALSLMEEIINEVSAGALARAAENNFNKRREVAKDSTEKAKKAYDSYEKQSKEHPEDEEVLYKAASKLGNVAHKDREKASHANDLINLNLPKDSKVSANKLFNAADKTYKNRGKDVDKALEKGKGNGDKEFDSSMKKYARAVDLVVADPVVARRTNEALIEEDNHHANKKNPVVKITDKNYQVASGKSLPGPFNKNHVGQYIVYNKDTDASYLVTPDNWKKSKIKKDLESHGKFYEAFEETLKLLELFDRPDLLNDIDNLLGSPVKKAKDRLLKKIFEPKKKKEEKKTKVACKENLEERKEK